MGLSLTAHAYVNQLIRGQGILGHTDFVSSQHTRHQIIAPVLVERPFGLGLINGIISICLKRGSYDGLACFIKGSDVNISSALGLLFIVGRALYARGYLRDPATRGPGFGLTLLANALLLGGGLIGAALRLL